ncbi:MAG: phosphoglycolate phosphatase [Acidobacteriota bacterium]
MIRVIVFDFDGTLYDTRQDIADAVNFARRHFGLPELTLEEVTRMVGWGVQRLAEQAFAGTGVPVEEGLAKIMEYYSAHPGDKAILYPGVRETLPRLPKPRVIVSNKPVALIRSMLEQAGLADEFDLVLGGDSFSVRKPDPFLIRYLQARYNVATDEILVVGDHAPDIEMARRAGCPSVFCRYGFFGTDEVGADYTIERFAELPFILETLNAAQRDELPSKGGIH